MSNSRMLQYHWYVKFKFNLDFFFFSETHIWIFWLQINQERMGLHIDCSSLKNVFLVFMEMHKHTGIAYYEGFESVMLEETSNYYCQMAQQWLSHGSPADYVQKVFFSYFCLRYQWSWCLFGTWNTTLSFKILL